MTHPSYVPPPDQPARSVPNSAGAAVIGAAAALLGALIGGGATYFAQDLAFDQQNTASQQELRRDAYVKFLSTVDRALVIGEPYYRCTRIHSGKSYELCEKQRMAAIGKLRPEWSAALDLVYLYGSRASVERSVKLSNEVSITLVRLPDEEKVIEKDTETAFIRIGFLKQDFRRSVCREVNPTSSIACE